MKKVLCSTGALIGRPNNRDYRLIKEFAPGLECDGFEFMMYSTWYHQVEKLINELKNSLNEKLKSRKSKKICSERLV